MNKKEISSKSNLELCVYLLEIGKELVYKRYVNIYPGTFYLKIQNHIEKVITVLSEGKISSKE